MQQLTIGHPPHRVSCAISAFEKGFNDSALALGHEVYYCYDGAGAVDKMSMMATMPRETQMGAVVLPWYAVAVDWQKNWTLPGGQGLGEIFAEHLVHYEYVAQAQQDNMEAGASATGTKLKS